MIDGPAAVAALEAAGFTHLVWIPDSHFGAWEAALPASRLKPIRPCREGEAVGIAAGLMLGGARPVVVMQCTGFFEAGDAVRNVVHDLLLPLKLIVGVRGWHAARAGRAADNCPHFILPVMTAWEVSWNLVDSAMSPAAVADLLYGVVEHPGAAALLWGE